MKYLLDTNILVRLVEKNDPLHEQTSAVLTSLRKERSAFFINLQIASEFWNVCTRPLDNNGLNFSAAAAADRLARFDKLFPKLHENEMVYSTWRELVVKHAVRVVKTHDAKLVASMLAHGVDKLHTYNSADFKRLTEVRAIDPRNLE